jgi:hypothetical protein
MQEVKCRGLLILTNRELFTPALGREDTTNFVPKILMMVTTRVRGRQMPDMEKVKLNGLMELVTEENGEMAKQMERALL